MTATLPGVPIDPAIRSRILDQYVEEVGPYMTARTRLQGQPWATNHVAALDQVVDAIMERIAREHGLETIENI